MEDKNKLGIESGDELSPELMDSLSQWAQMEGYSHRPEDLVKLFLGPQGDKK